jgi:D-apionolactonase
MTVPPTPQQLWYGRDDPAVELRPCRGGGTTLEIHGIDVRRVRWGAFHLVDRIYVAVRDLDWGTIPPVISDVEVRSDKATPLDMTFKARNRAGAISFAWDGLIHLDADGVLAYDMSGVAEGDFRYNRIGICVLHPAGSSAGRPFVAQTPTGPWDGVLPHLIAPQTIVDGHEIALFPAFTALDIYLGELDLRIEFEGDLFETEDQRNWTDDSFKTYSGPISLGYPHDARDGQRFHQRITVTPRPPVAQRAEEEVHGVGLDVWVGRQAGVWPRLGLGMSSDGRALGDREIALLREVAPEHLRVDLHLGRDDWTGELERAATDARGLSSALEVACYADEASLAEAAELGRRLRSLDVARILAFHEASAGTGTTPAGWLASLRAALGPGFDGVPFMVGTDGDFAELNRDRPDMAGADGVCYSMNPQIHAYDELSMAETLPAQGATVATAKSFAGDLEVVISPVTLKQRFNPAADPDAAAPEPGALPAAVDPRVPSLFGAGWALGSLASLVVAGASSVTFFETAGWRGLLEWVDGVSRPVEWHGPLRGTYPAYHVFADLGDRHAFAAMGCGVTDPAAVAALAMRALDRSGMRLLVANLTPRDLHLTMLGGPAGPVTFRVLDDSNAAAALADPAAFRASGRQIPPWKGALRLDLRPFAYARLDGPLPG